MVGEIRFPRSIDVPVGGPSTASRLSDPTTRCDKAQGIFGKLVRIFLSLPEFKGLHDQSQKSNKPYLLHRSLSHFALISARSCKHCRRNSRRERHIPVEANQRQLFIPGLVMSKILI